MIRYLKFNAVGVLGAAVQLAALALFVRVLGLHYLAATALAVEAAVLHNFVWHENWTWKERGGGGAAAVALRMFRFHLGNGLVSILSNLFLMSLFTGWLGLHYIPANVLSILVTSVANFLIGDWFVYARE